MKKYCAAGLVLALALFGCAGAGKPVETSFFAMDTLMNIKAYGENAQTALGNCEGEVRRLETLLSATDPGSDVYRLNHGNGATVAVSPETGALLSYGGEIGKATGGAFDMTVYPLVRLWGFLPEEGGEGEEPAEASGSRVPSEDEILTELGHVGPEKLTVGEGWARLEKGAGVDLGAIAKGYAGDCLCGILKRDGVDSALISLGGNVQALGSKPDGSPWKVAIQDPADASAVIGVVDAVDAAVVTAGGYQRYFEENGKRYHHILDPRSGRPAQSGLASVTVIASSGAQADALATALFVMGLNRAADFWRQNGGFSAVFVLDQGQIYHTEGLTFASSGAQVYIIA